MTEDRFGELLGSIGWALVNDATPEERAELIARWGEVGKSMPVALAAASAVLAAKPNIQAMIAESVTTFVQKAGKQPAAKPRR